MAPRKARVEGAAAKPIDGDSFANQVDAFKANHPAKWEEIRLCPAQHALDVMAEILG